jgi:hypothetical protein
MKMGSLTKKFLAVAMVGAALLTAGCGRGYNSGNGTQVGTIGRIGTHGAWCPSVEGEMALLNMRGASGSSTLHFTVFDKEVEKKLQKAMEDGNAVEVTWEKRSMTGPCTMESDHIITAVKEFNESSSRESPKMNLVTSGSTLPNGTLPTSGTVNLSCVPGANNTLSCAVK